MRAQVESCTTSTGQEGGETIKWKSRGKWKNAEHVKKKKSNVYAYGGICMRERAREWYSVRRVNSWTDIIGETINNEERTLKI